MNSAIELNIVLDTLESSILDDYLEEMRKRSDNTYYQGKSNLFACLNYINKPLKEINRKDMKSYLAYLDSRSLKYSTKQIMRSKLNAFFEYLEYELESEGVDYRNPVPSSKQFKFSQHEADMKEKSFDETIYSDQQLLDLLDHSKKRSLRDFIFFGLLIATGMRVSECLSIERKNIDLENRSIKTGYIKNARKSRKELTFYIPEKFVIYLEFYMTHLKNTVWLFPGASTNHWQNSSVSMYIVRHYPKYTQFHRFRKTIITNRVMKMQCPEWVSEGLTNHKVSGTTQRDHYIKISDQERRDLYDKYFPYYSFPFF